MLCIAGDHHHFPVCCWCAAALHAVPASGGPSDSQAWPTRPNAAQWGGLWSKCCFIRVYFKLGLISLYWINACVCVCLLSGHTTANEQRPGESKHGPGAGRRCSAALEEAGPGATQDCLWPPQNAELNSRGDLRCRESNLSWLSALLLPPALPLLCTAPPNKHSLTIPFCSSSKFQVGQFRNLWVKKICCW